MAFSITIHHCFSADQVNRARENFYVHARNLRIGFGIMRYIQASLERQGYKGLQWSSDPHKHGGLCEPMADVFRGKVGRDIKLLPSQISFSLTAFHTDIFFGCCNRKLKLNELHGVSLMLHHKSFWMSEKLVQRLQFSILIVQ